MVLSFAVPFPLNLFSPSLSFFVSMTANNSPGQDIDGYRRGRKKQGKVETSEGWDVCGDRRDGYSSSEIMK